VTIETTKFEFTDEATSAQMVDLGDSFLTRDLPIYKRFFDTVVVIPLVLCFLFSLFWVVLLNPFFNKGGVFFKQRRVGLNGKIFTVLKFRTMVGGSQLDKFEHEEQGRITGFGDFLRRTRIDELPQIWNVFVGDMSLIGPRPERPRFVKEYLSEIPDYSRRHTVRPGISGLAQLRYGYTSDVAGTERKLRWDLEYINRMSFRLDMVILGQTARVVFGRMFFIDVKTKL
jgi:lipopolysaccharide/colanic/teichoic acid biosynthesis glycosyltransferase